MERAAWERGKLEMERVRLKGEVADRKREPRGKEWRERGRS